MHNSALFIQLIPKMVLLGEHGFLGIKASRSIVIPFAAVAAIAYLAIPEDPEVENNDIPGPIDPPGEGG